MAELEIIGVPFSNYVRSVRMLCEEKGVPYKLTPSLPQSPEVKAIHPAGQVPVAKHGDVSLFESKAIATYVDRAFPGPMFIPKDPVAHALVEQWVSYGNVKVDRWIMREFVVPSVFFDKAKGPDTAKIAAALPEGDTPEESPIEPPAPPEGGLQTVFRFQKAGAAVAAADLREASHQKADGKPPTGDPWSAGSAVGTPASSALHSVKDEQRESNLATGMTALPRESDVTDARAGSAVHGRRSSWMSGPRAEVSPASTSLSDTAASPVMSSGHDVSDLSRVPGRGAPSEFISASEAPPDAPTPPTTAPAQARLAALQQRTRARSEEHTSELQSR